MENVKWEPAEVALILVWRDYCEKHNLDYDNTIIQELIKVPRTDHKTRIGVTLTAVKNKLYKMFMRKGKQSWRSFMDKGVESMHELELSQETIQEISRLQNQWDLGLWMDEPVVISDQNTVELEKPNVSITLCDEPLIMTDSVVRKALS
jgi:hypothetical protein